MSEHSPQPEKIRSMFGQVASKYDQANSVLSLGIHHLWRKQLVQDSEATWGDDVLDCATGTGDLAIAFKKMVGEEGRVVGTDFCEEMLSFAPEKARKQELEIQFEKADVMNLQYEDNSFDICSISFGIRNVADPVKALKEMVRVVRPGGRVMILEFGQAETPLFAPLFNFYSQKILPALGGCITGQKEAYQYLQESSAQFPCREEFIKMMKDTGLFQQSTYRTLTGGVAYIYRGVKK
jgi:demethylmenaquinone methyltransferase/2-methoxy-6-polyprenyl-1,4-benzoquinol methylase